MKELINSTSTKNQKIINILNLKKQTKIEKKSIWNLNESKISQESSSVKRFSNSKSKIRNEPTQIFSFNLNKTSLSIGNDFNNKNMMEINKTNNFLDKVLTSVGDNYKKSKTKKSNSSLDLKEYNHETNLLSKLSSIENKLNSFTFYSPNEKGENFVLVEKRFSDNLKLENETLKNRLTNLKDQLDEAKENFNKIAAEVTFIKQLNESQQKLKNENTKRSKVLEREIEDIKKANEEMKNVLTVKKLEKDDLERAICNYTKLYDPKLFNDLKILYQSYNNQYFMARYKPADEQEIQKILGVMSLLEKQINLKKNEINGLNKYLKVENKEKDDVTVKASTKILRRVSSKIK